MAGTYSQIYIQVVFAVKGRRHLLGKEWRSEVFKYMCGMIKNKGHKPIIVNGVSDHVQGFLKLMSDRNFAPPSPRDLRLRAVQVRTQRNQKNFADFALFAVPFRKISGSTSFLRKPWDHVHVFIGLEPAMALSDLVRDIKNNSSNFINDHAWIPGRFCWQEGDGAFSYSHSQIAYVYNYILNQEQHHSQQTFQAEYLDFLQKYEIEHNVKYLFEWME